MNSSKTSNCEFAEADEDTVFPNRSSFVVTGEGRYKSSKIDCDSLPCGDFECGMNEAGNFNLPGNENKPFVERSAFVSDWHCQQEVSSSSSTTTTVTRDSTLKMSQSSSTNTERTDADSGHSTFTSPPLWQPINQKKTHFQVKFLSQRKKSKHYSNNKNIRCSLP